MAQRNFPLALTALLLATAAGAAEKPAKADANDPDRVICKREASIGSLVAAKKVCMTRAQWTAQMQQAQADTRKMQETTGGPQ